ncbi:MAG: hypothetical protein KAH22_00255 [Thiotrichaceae bacterium]|nr:hypothetical protein [Thiotrichaceae bacterium]
MILESLITCPLCSHQEQQQMLENVNQQYYRCQSCQQQIKASEKSCCIYCCYSNTPCPTAQITGSACCASDD